MDKWEEHLKQKLTDFEAAPPRDVWSDIEKRLPSAKPQRRVISAIFRRSRIGFDCRSVRHTAV